MQLPSGTVLTEDVVELIKSFARIGFVEWRDKPIRLKSGVMSRVYVQGRDDLTSNPHVLSKLGEHIHEETALVIPEDKRTVCYIGLPTAGSPLASAASLYSVEVDHPAAIFYQMREEKKVTHGASSGWVIGKPKPAEHIYVTLDNVITDGQTKIDMERRFAEDGFPTGDMYHIIVVDRQQGGLERLEEYGMKNVKTLFNLLDLTYVYRELNLWPAEAVEMVEREIAEHRAQKK